MRKPVPTKSEENPADDAAPSRSQLRRDALAVAKLAEDLAALSPAKLAALALPDAIRAGVDEVRHTPAHGAHQRALKHLAKVLRTHDHMLDELTSQVQADRASRAQETAALHRLEAWRQRLLAEGDAAVAELATSYPDLDRPRLRVLIRNARREAERAAPPKAYREILRLLREL